MYIYKEDRSRGNVTEYFLQRFIERMPEGGKVLDAGCGTGFVSEYLSKKGFRVVSVDRNEEVLDKGKEMDRFQTCREMDITDMSFERGSFDGIISIEVVEHLDRPRDFIGEAHRLLTDEGVLALKSPNKILHDMYHIFLNQNLRILRDGNLYYHPSVMKPKELSNLLEENGFRPRFIKSEALTSRQKDKLGLISQTINYINLKNMPVYLQPSNRFICEKK